MKIGNVGDVKKAFFISVIAFYLILDITIAVYVITWSNIISVLMYILLSFFLISFSFQFVKRLFTLFLKPYELPRLDALSTHPKVAILYATMNDVMPNCLSKINQTYPCDVFVLDDSTDSEKRKIVDKISAEKNFTVIRREERKEFKAGAVNNWFHTYGSGYDYFVLLDSDSLIPTDWAENALKYAEHPDNSRVAIFQGLINIWNSENNFVKTLSSMHKIDQNVWERRLGNYLDAVFCYGHNCIVRTTAISEIGGFVGGYVSEDFATAVKLAEHGYKCRFVPLDTFEALPENIRGFIKRQNKWTKGSMEFFSFLRAKISLSKKVLLSLIPLGHVSYFFILLAMFITIYGYTSTQMHFNLFLQYLINYHVYFIWSIPIFRYVIILNIIQAIPANILLFKFKISGFTHIKHKILSSAVGAIMMPYEISSTISYLINRKKSFPVTPKYEPYLSFTEILKISKITILLVALLTVGIIFINPLGIFFNILWILPFYFSPFIVYYFCRPISSKMEEEFNLS